MLHAGVMKRCLVLVCLSWALVACASDSPSSSDPTLAPTSASAEARSADAVEAAFEEWVNAENSGDCEAVKSRVTQPDLIDCDEVADREGSWDDFLDMDSLHYDVSITNDSAVIELSDDQGEQGLWDMQWVDGRWLVVSEADDI